MAWEWLDKALGWAGDFIGDNAGDWITELIRENPNMSVKQILELQRQQNAMNNPNVNTPFGSTQISYDDQGVPTVDQIMPQGVLNLANSLGRRMSGDVNAIRQVGPDSSLRSGGQNLINSWERGRGMDETTHNWWDPTPREQVDWVDFVNPGTLGGGGGYSGGGGGGSMGPDPGMGGGPNDELGDATYNFGQQLDEYFMLRPIYDQDGNEIPWQSTPLDQELNDLLSRLPSGPGQWIAENIGSFLGFIGDIFTGDLGEAGGKALGDLVADAYCTANACTEADLFQLYQEMEDFIDDKGAYFGRRDMSDDIANPPTGEENGIPDDVFRDDGGFGIGDRYGWRGLDFSLGGGTGGGGSYNCSPSDTGVICVKNEN